jgi:hypothetical protein
VDTNPLEDEYIDLDEPTRSTSRRWNRQAPTQASRCAAIISRNTTRIERANTAHYRLELLLNQSATGLGYEPQENAHIDMHFPTAAAQVLAEMKSCHRNNLHAQVRRGIGQLLEYRYVYRDRLGANPACLLVLETRPMSSNEWLIEYAATLSVLIAWPDPARERLITTGTIPEALEGLVATT